MVLLGGLSISFVGLFWKSFAKRPGEKARALIATLVGAFGLIIFFSYVSFLTLKPGEDLIKFIELLFE